MAAVLAAGRGAVLSHRTAATVWGMLRSSRLEAIVVKQQKPRRGLHLRCCFLAPDEVTIVRGIPVTGVSRTLLDLAAVLHRRRLERAMNEAEILGLAERVSLRELLARYPGRPGTPAIRALLGTRAPLTRSELEPLFLDFLEARSLPAPETNAWLLVRGSWIECDCVWRSRRVVVELDGRTVHDTAAAFERDRARDRRLHAAGWRVVRITWRQLREEPEALAADLRAVLGRASL
jgi:hypothetical protein